MSKVSRCRLENVENLDASEIKYSSSRLRKKINTFEIMLTSTTAHGFYAIFLLKQTVKVTKTAISTYS